MKEFSTRRNDFRFVVNVFTLEGSRYENCLGTTARKANGAGVLVQEEERTE